MRVLRALAFTFLLAGVVPTCLAADYVSATGVVFGQNTALAGVASTGISTIIRTEGYSACFAQISSATTSVALIQMEGSTDSDGPWQILGAVTDPDSDGEYYGGPCPSYLRLNVATWVSGTLTGELTWRK